MSFKVPESCRVTTGPAASSYTNGKCGMFLVRSPSPGWGLMLVCHDGIQSDPGQPPETLGWEHVSVHAFAADNPKRKRTPSWSEMCHVKDICWDEEDVVMQLHPKKSEYVNCHTAVLHLWRPIHVAIPTPPRLLV